MCYIISDADKIQFDGERQENQKFILYNAWKMVKMDKNGQYGQVDQDSRDSRIDQDGQNQEPNDQPAKIYLAGQGLVAARHAPTFLLSKISGNKSSVL